MDIQTTIPDPLFEIGDKVRIKRTGNEGVIELQWFDVDFGRISQEHTVIRGEWQYQVGYAGILGGSYSNYYPEGRLVLVKHVSETAR